MRVNTAFTLIILRILTKLLRILLLFSFPEFCSYCSFTAVCWLSRSATQLRSREVGGEREGGISRRLYISWFAFVFLGAGIAQWLERRTARDSKVAGSNPCWNGGRIFFSRVDFLCWLLFRYPFHPRVTTVARKKSRSFCQKCRWQVTAKTRIHLTYVAFIEPCFGIGHNLSLICQMTSEDIKHQLIIIIIVFLFVC